MQDRVAASVHYTRNLGNFENVKVHFEIASDVRPEETIDQAAARVYGKAEALVGDRIREIDEEAAGK